jgi:hypothetical protein
MEDVIDRFRRGVEAWGRAHECFQARDREGHERRLAEAFLEVSRACEGALTHAYSRVFGDHDSARLNPADMLRRLTGKRRGTYGNDLLARLGEHRRRRNQVEHGALVPTVATVEVALADTRRFLLDELSIPAERLTSFEPEAAAAISDSSASVLDLVLSQDPQGYVQRAIERGLAVLARRQPDQTGLLHGALRHDARPLLARAARSLATAGLAPGDPLPDDILIADFLRDETELRAELMRNADGSGGPRLDQRLALLLRRSALCERAEWFGTVEGADQLTFRQPLLAQVLVGLLASAGPETAKDGRQLARDWRWAVAVWANAMAHGVAPEWIATILADLEPAAFVGQTAALCLALSALQPGQARGVELQRALALALHGLVAFAPQEQHPAPAWQLPMELWCACALGLATASRNLGEEFFIDLAVLEHCPAPLRALLVALSIPPDNRRLSGLAALCLLGQTITTGALDAATIAVVADIDPFIVAWVRHHFIPVALASRNPMYLDLMARIAPNHPANLLPRDADLHEDWFRAWAQLVRPDAEPMIEAWLSAVLWQLQGESTEQRIELFLRRCPQRLREGCLWSAAREMLRAKLIEWSLPDTATPFVHELFRLAEMDQDAWRTHLTDRRSKPELPWKCLLECGAPHDLVAEWALSVLAEKVRAPSALREGPIGVIASRNLRVVSQGPWKLAFEQAPACLMWLLAHGDAEGLAVLAESCLAPFDEGAHFDPILGKNAVNLHVPLSQVFWSQILTRANGRRVLYDRIERDACVGLWLSWEPLLKALQVFESDPSIADEIPLMFACFERWLGTAWIVDANVHQFEPYFQARGLSPPARYPFALRLDQNPWLRREWPIEQVIVVGLAARRGLGVGGPWFTIATKAAGDMRIEPAASFWHQALGILAAGFYWLRQQHPDQVASIVEHAGFQEIAGLMCADDTTVFWRTCAELLGRDRLLAVLDDLRAHDRGCSAIEVLAELDSAALTERWDEPAYLAPALRAAARGTLRGSDGLWRRLWGQPRSLTVVERYLDTPPGPRLDAIFDALAAWPPADRTPILRSIARNSPHNQARVRSLAHLQQEDVGKGAP